MTKHPVLMNGFERTALSVQAFNCNVTHFPYTIEKTLFIVSRQTLRKPTIRNYRVLGEFHAPFFTTHIFIAT